MLKRLENTMSGTLIPPECEVFPNRIRWTTDDCDRLREGGYLSGRYELIDGEIISKMGQGPTHSFVLIVIADFLITLFGGLRVRQQLPITIPGEDGLYTEPEPDIAVTVKEASAYKGRHPGPGELALVVEIADSSIAFDISTKSLMYARAGVAEYWVVDISNRHVHVHQAPLDSGFADVSSYEAGNVILVPGTEDAEVRVEDLLPPLDLNTDEAVG
jgi:Uma2 family endonuclease